MAKKKQIELTIEEKLQNALVPKEEQPYKIPSNWCWTRLTFLSDLLTGNSINAKEKENKYMNLSEGYNYIATKDISFNSNINYNNGVKIPFENNFKIAKKNSSLLCIEGGSAGRKIGFLNQDVCFVNKLCAFYPIKIEAKYLFYFLQSPIFNISFKEKMNGLIGGVSVAKLKDIPIILPPINEQQRIVNRIESLFVKLDRAKELIENTLAQWEQNKMAILHKAFTGELTAKWRKENNIDLSSWQEKTIDELCTSLKYGTSKKSKPEGSVVVLRMGNLQNGEIDWSNLMYTDDKDDIEKYLLKKGDVLFNRTNSPELVGKTSIYRGEYPAIYAGYLIKLDYGKDIIGEYLNYMMNSTKAKYYCYTVKTDGVSQSNINAKKIGAFEIPVPTIEEQQEIVNILDKLLAKYNKIKNLEQQLEKIELLKKAILAKAFRGELGTNNPDEESAENLLKEILAEK